MKNDRLILNHEKIHLKQQLELLWIFFFIWYITEYLINLIRYKNALTAYQKISFEREAYANEQNPDYLKSRKFWNFLKYLT